MAYEKLRDKKKQLIRETIFTTAQRLFVEQGFEETTIQQIADDAGISRASFFNYFSGKPGLLTAMIEDMQKRFVSLIEEQRLRPASTQERLVTFFCYSAAVINKTESFSRILFSAFDNAYTEASDKYAVNLQIHNAYKELLTIGIEQNDVRIDYSLNVLVELVTAAFTQVINNWVNDTAYPLEQRFEEMAKLIGESIAPKKTCR